MEYTYLTLSPSEKTSLNLFSHFVKWSIFICLTFYTYNRNYIQMNALLRLFNAGKCTHHFATFFVIFYILYFCNFHAHALRNIYRIICCYIKFTFKRQKHTYNNYCLSLNMQISRYANEFAKSTVDLGVVLFCFKQILKKFQSTIKLKKINIYAFIIILCCFTFILEFNCHTLGTRSPFFF